MNFVPKSPFMFKIIDFYRLHTIVKNYCRLLTQRLSPDSTRRTLDVHYLQPTRGSDQMSWFLF